MTVIPTLFLSLVLSASGCVSSPRTPAGNSAEHTMQVDSLTPSTAPLSSARDNSSGPDPGSDTDQVPKVVPDKVSGSALQEPMPTTPAMSVPTSTIELPLAHGPDHRVWSQLLAAFVTDRGMVDYYAIGRDPRFAAYLAQLSAAKPDAAWNANERKAFWINVYNAFTVKLIVDHADVASIKDIKGPWSTKFFSLNGTAMDLETVEHEELRAKLKDPRIHFAINCASYSCPQLWNKAYTADGLDAQLDAAARRFINDTERNRLNGDRAELSEIFDWFTKDFTQGQSLVEFINRYATKLLAADARISYLDYDWRLNTK